MEIDTTPPERRLLLSAESVTDVPWLQLANALLVEFCVALERQSILPFINQLIGELDVVMGDNRQIGYYLGLLGSVRYIANTLTTFPLSRLSDRIGRKPVMLGGMVASTISILCFGLSRTFLGLVVSACIGALNCNIGMTKIIVGEITDSTNRARGFAWVLMLWSVGGSISSLIGGGLSKPSDRFPNFFYGTFWKQYPYFLPCLVVAIITVLSFFFVLFSFEETLPDCSQDLGDSFSLQSNRCRDGPPSIRKLVTYPVIIAIANCTIFDTLFSSADILVPLFLALPVELGGLGFDSITIGYILGSYRAFTAFFLIVCSPRIVRHLGERRAFRLAIYTTMFAWVVMPTANILARHSGITTSVWVCIAFLALLDAFLAMGTACSCIYITAAAPSHDTLGAVNGLSRTTAAIGNAMTPLMATSFFSLSIEYKICGGYAVYIVLLTLSSFAIWLTTGLRRVTRPLWEGDSGVIGR